VTGRHRCWSGCWLGCWPVLLAAGLLGLAAPARAHDESVSSSDIIVEGGRVTWTVDVGLAGLAKVVPLARAPVAG
jgi:hypothetical protein